MTRTDFVALLRAHLAALRSSAWPRPHGHDTGPVIFLTEAETEALLTELTTAKV